MSHNRIPRFAVAAAAAAFLLGLAPANAAWRFAIPEGWTDLSPGKAVPAGVPEEVTSVTQSGVFHTYAMDLKGAKDGFGTNLNAMVRPGALVADERSLETLVGALPAQARSELPGATVKVLEQAVAPLGGIPTLRVVADLKTQDLSLRILRYAIPGGKEVAVLTYASTDKDFERYLPAFEAAALQTEGAANPPFAARIGASLREMAGDSLSDEDWVKIFGLGGKIIGAIVAVGLLSFFSRRFGKKKQGTMGM